MSKKLKNLNKFEKNKRLQIFSKRSKVKVKKDAKELKTDSAKICLKCRLTLFNAA